jgi:hypothetical protein
MSHFQLKYLAMEGTLRARMEFRFLVGDSAWALIVKMTEPQAVNPSQTEKRTDLRTSLGVMAMIYETQPVDDSAFLSVVNDPKMTGCSC